MPFEIPESGERFASGRRRINGRKPMPEGEECAPEGTLGGRGHRVGGCLETDARTPSGFKPRFLGVDDLYEVWDVYKVRDDPAAYYCLAEIYRQKGDHEALGKLHARARDRGMNPLFLEWLALQVSPVSKPATGGGTTPAGDSCSLEVHMGHLRVSGEKLHLRVGSGRARVSGTIHTR